MIKIPFRKRFSTPTITMSACRADQTAAEMLLTNEDEISKSSSLVQHDNSLKEHHYALLIGINNYGDINANLHGCINDVVLFKEKIIVGFEEIRVVLDEDATKENVLENIKWLVSHDNVFDSLFLFFSGHGSWTLTTNGKGYECCICCSDCLKDWDNGVITRSELISAINRKKSSLAIFLDSCYSGGMNEGYRVWKRLPKKVEEELYGRSQQERSLKNIRALAGPKWFKIAEAMQVLSLSRREIRKKIAQGKITTRKVRGYGLFIKV
jgi:hypothetical protein